REGTERPAEAVLAFAWERRARPTAARLVDYDYRAPLVRNEAALGTDDDPALGSDALARDEFESLAGNDGRRATPRGARTALEQHRTAVVRVAGASDCRDLAPGCRFVLDGHDVASLNREWTPTEVVHEGRVAWLAVAREAPGTPAAPV